MRTRLLKLGIGIYALIAVLIVLTAPRNSYEWMLSDPALSAEPLSFCSLPLDDREATALFPLVFTVPLLALAVWMLRRHHTMLTAFALVPFACWLLRFVILFPICASHA